MPDSPCPPLKPVTLTGERVQLVPLGPEHIDALLPLAQEPGVWTYMPGPMRDRADMERSIAAALEARERGVELPFATLDRQTGRPVGATRFLDYDTANRGIEIGWTWLAPSVWRTHVNTEAKLLMLEHAFEELRVNRVQLKTDARNERSQAAIARLGAVREGVLRHHRVMPDGYLRDSVYFSILAEEWPDVRSNLRNRLRDHRVDR